MSDKLEATGYVGASIAEARARERREQAVAEITAAFLDVQAEIARAVEKHGYARTPLSRDPADAGKKLAVLIEEVGEVAHALNYDSANQDNLKAELVQVAAMALAWRASLSQASATIEGGRETRNMKETENV